MDALHFVRQVAAELADLEEMGRATLVMSDPPWSFDRQGLNLHGAVGARYPTTPMRQIVKVLAESRAMCADRAYLVVWVPNSLLAEFFAAVHGAYWPWRQVACYTWGKARMGCGWHLRNSTEQALVFTTEAGGRAGARDVRSLRVHPRQQHSRKPVACAADHVAAFSQLGDLVVELYTGVWAPGCLAAAWAGRRALGCELVPSRHEQALAYLSAQVPDHLGDELAKGSRIIRSGVPDLSEYLGLSRTALLLHLLIEQRPQLVREGAPTLAGMLGVTDRQIRRGLAQLQAAGLVQPNARRRLNGRRVRRGK